MRWHALAAPVAALALLPGAGRAQSATPQSQAAGRVSGTVVEAIAQRPIQGVTVTLVGRDTIRATTNPQGEFTFGRVPPGAYAVRTLAIGYVAGEQRVTVDADATVPVRVVLQRAAV